jgi:hypothetical protein
MGVFDRFSNNPSRSRAASHNPDAEHAYFSGMAARGELDEVSGHLPIDHETFTRALNRAANYRATRNPVQFWEAVVVGAGSLRQAADRMGELSNRAVRHYEQMCRVVNGGDI